jgi:hypothetical protein
MYLNVPLHLLQRLDSVDAPPGLGDLLAFALERRS